MIPLIAFFAALATVIVWANRAQHQGPPLTPEEEAELEQHRGW